MLERYLAGGTGAISAGAWRDESVPRGTESGRAVVILEYLPRGALVSLRVGVGHRVRFLAWVFFLRFGLGCLMHEVRVLLSIWPRLHFGVFVTFFGAEVLVGGGTEVGIALPWNVALDGAPKIDGCGSGAARHPSAVSHTGGTSASADARRARRAFMGVIQRGTSFDAPRHQMRRRQKEHITTRRARVHKRRFFTRSPRRNQRHTTRTTNPRHTPNFKSTFRLKHLTTTPSARPTTRTFRADTFRLILIHILLRIPILRDQPIKRIKEQPATIRQITRLIHSIFVRLRCPRRYVRR